MARDQIDMTPIETRDELVAWLEAGCKSRAQFRVGTEHEKFAFTIKDHRPVPYEGPRSIRARAAVSVLRAISLAMFSFEFAMIVLS